jgi:hypothetical protein
MLTMLMLMAFLAKPMLKVNKPLFILEQTIFTRNFGFYNYRLQLKFSCMWHMQLQICVVT